MRPDNAAELRHGICESDTNTSCNGAIESANAFRPDNGIGGAGTGNGDDECEVFDYCIGDGDEDDVADNGSKLDCNY